MNNEIWLGDCLEKMRTMETESIDLIYLDPPFFTQKVHKLKTKDRTQEFSFSDIWKSHSEYAEFLHIRLQEMSRILSNNGSIFVHCDKNASHIIRFLLDDIFGEKNFRSEIIWYYKRWSNSQKNLIPSHQTIYFYTKTNQYTFNTIYQNYSASTNIDQILQKRTRDEFGKAIYDRNEEGNIISNGGKKGVPLPDVWEIPYLNPKAHERTGYPTQKPILLLERIINLVTNEGDIILDPFCGSGTTLVAAKLLNRKYIGIDISEEAIKIAQNRVDNPLKTNSNLLEKGRESYQNSDETLLSMLLGLEYAPVQRNQGIDAILKQDLDGFPITIKIQRPEETVSEAALKLSKASQNKNVKIMFLITFKKQEYLDKLVTIPPEVTIIEAPSLIINNILNHCSQKSLVTT